MACVRRPAYFVSCSVRLLPWLIRDPHHPCIYTILLDHSLNVTVCIHWDCAPAQLVNTFPIGGQLVWFDGGGERRLPAGAAVRHVLLCWTTTVCLRVERQSPPISPRNRSLVPGHLPPIMGPGSRGLIARHINSGLLKPGTRRTDQRRLGCYATLVRWRQSWCISL